MASLSFFLLLLLLLLPLLVAMLFLKKNKKLNHPPSPPKLPIIGNLHQLGNLPHHSLHQLSNKYGPMMLLHFGHMPTLVVSSPEIAKEVLKTHDLSLCSRPSFVGPKRLSYDFHDIVFSPYNDYWKEIRRICVQELFSTKKVQSFGFVREEEVAKMITSISEYEGRPVNLTKELYSLTFRMICRIGFGKSYEGEELDNGELHQLLYEIMNILGTPAASDLYPSFGWILDGVSGLNKRIEKCFKSFDAFYQKILDEHLDPNRKKPEQEDIIDVLLELQKNQVGTTLTTSNIKAILMDVFLGGIDTSSVTMVWAMTELIRKPEIMKKVQDDIRGHIGAKGKVEEVDVDKLDYLKMVIKETLRMHPPVMLLIPRECMKHCKINGYDIEPKTRILVNAWAIGRDDKYWENPNEFIPERFMNKSIDFKGQDFEFLPFGSGRRVCPGMNMGIANLELALANLLYCFEWELPNGLAKEDINMEEDVGLVVHKKVPLELVPKK